jgi:UDP-N-acetylmuramoylalanine--D-glutamate ligase
MSKVAIIGYGVEGQAAYKYWTGLGHEVVIHDADASREFPDGAKVVAGPNYLKNLDEYDIVSRGPGVKPWEVKTKARITSVTDEFFRQCPARIIGVTGTKGKGTTCALIGRILGEAGWRTWVGGNIGQPPLDFLGKVRANHLAILEMSSFELMDLNISPHIAVCLMIVPEHMNWHRSMREYVAAKGNIFWHQRPEDMAVYNPRNEYSTQIAQLSPGTKVPYLEAPGAYVEGGNINIDGQVICKTSEVGLIGPHNLENITAAITATWDLVKHNNEPVGRAVTAFTGLEHRLELVREFAGVRYYDDSFATTPETTMAAMASFEQPKVLILGGSDKQSDYTELAKAIAAGNIRHAVLIGVMGAKIRSALEAAGFTKAVMGSNSMVDIVRSARALAQKGDVVLLSPACASFDMFTNYKDRGNQFKAAVKDLR